MEKNRRNFIKPTLAATSDVIVASYSSVTKAAQSSSYKSVFRLISKPLDISLKK